MGAAMSSSYGRMLERAWRAGAPRKPCWATPEVTGGGFIGSFILRTLGALGVTGYGLRVTGYGLRVTGYGTKKILTDQGPDISIVPRGLEPLLAAPAREADRCACVHLAGLPPLLLLVVDLAILLLLLLPALVLAFAACVL